MTNTPHHTPHHLLPNWGAFELSEAQLRAFRSALELDIGWSIGWSDEQVRSAAMDTIRALHVLRAIERKYGPPDQS